MEFLKKSQKTSPKISLILLDWSVRESFHLLDYLSQQSVSNDLFEITLIEYYSTKTPHITEQQTKILDNWILLHSPKQNYYHKHLMYNIGIFFSKGEVVVICDSDMMAKPSFIQAIIDFFDCNQNSFLHIDQFRSHDRKFYPFNYPSFDDVLNNQCINFENGLTSGLAAKYDTIHKRNYGACFAARRSDLIEIGGADEHIDYVGHICGPYDLSFRLVIAGKKEVWHRTEFVYHTWHPGSDGVDNYLGPHDGRNLSTTAIDNFMIRQSQPHVMNSAIAALQKNPENFVVDDWRQLGLVNPSYNKILSLSFLCSEELKKFAKRTYRREISRLSSLCLSELATNPHQDLGYFLKLMILIISCSLLFFELIRKANVGLLRLLRLVAKREVLASKQLESNSFYGTECFKNKKRSIFFKKKLGYFIFYANQIKKKYQYEKLNIIKLVNSTRALKKTLDLKDSYAFFIDDKKEIVIFLLLMRSFRIKMHKTFEEGEIIQLQKKSKVLVTKNFFLRHYEGLKDDFSAGRIAVF